MPSTAPDSCPRWYVIQCKPQQDQRAFENLQRQGFTCYLPTLRAERWPHGRKQRPIEVQESLFPGYLFIHLDQLNDRWHRIRSTRGVNQIVRFREYPTPLSDEVIHLIRERQTHSSAIPYLKPGDSVIVTHGPFAYIAAIFIAKDGNERVKLLLNILQHDQQLNFPLTSVRKAQHDAAP